MKWLQCSRSKNNTDNQIGITAQRRNERERNGIKCKTTGLRVHSQINSQSISSMSRSSYRPSSQLNEFSAKFHSETSRWISRNCCFFVSSCFSFEFRSCVRQFQCWLIALHMKCQFSHLKLSLNGVVKKSKMKLFDIKSKTRCKYCADERYTAINMWLSE